MCKYCVAFCETIRHYCRGVYLPVNSIVRKSVEDVVDDIGWCVIATQICKNGSFQSIWNELHLLRDREKITWCMNLVLANGLMDGLIDCVGMILVSQVVQHIHWCVQHRNGIGDISSSNCRTRVTGSRFENRILDAERNLFREQEQKKELKQYSRDHHSSFLTTDQHHQSGRRLHST